LADLILSNSIAETSNAMRVAMVNTSRYCLFLAGVLAVAGSHVDRAIAQEPENGESSAGSTSAAAFDQQSLDFFESKIRQILVTNCHRCHGPQKEEAGLRLDSRSSILRGGDTGPAIVPHEPDQSLLIDAIRYGDIYQMPPKQQLPAREIALLEEWVRRGAPWPADESAGADSSAVAFDLYKRKRDHWAWNPISAPAVPDLSESHLATSAIDAFLLAKLAEASLERAGSADRSTLIRRATFDLIGMPPTVSEVEAFQTDLSADAFAKVVDRLLASPHFGERWARHWLDVVRYAETLGHEFDYPLTDAWRYRDYVIRALNADVSYDQFLREHIAGDLLHPPRLHPSEGYNESIIATAFWFLGEAVHAPVDSRADYATRIDNQIDVASKAFLGLTVACARCHDHKFDAISTKDYYALAGYLTSSRQQVALLDPADRIETGAKRLAEIQQLGRKTWSTVLPSASGESSDRFARCLLAARAAQGRTDPSTLDAIARENRIDRAVLERFIAAVADPAAQEPGHPLYAWNKLAGAQLPDESFLTRRSVLEAAIKQLSEQAADAAQEQQVFEDFSSGFDSWYRNGWAFGDAPTRWGDWISKPNGPELLDAGVAHSGRLGAKLPGVIRSVTFTIEKPYIMYRLSGRDAQVRLVVDGYMMDSFSELLFEGLSFKVNTDGGMHWHTQSVARYLGHRAYIEIIDSGSGYVAVDEIRFSSSIASQAPNDETASLVLAEPNVGSAESLAKAYGDVLTRSLQDWREGKSSPGAAFVHELVLRKLLPAESGMQLLLADLAKRAIDATLPEPVKVVAIADGSAENQPVSVRGNYKTPGEVVPRRLLEAIAGGEQPAPLHGSGRLELAERMLSVDNPFPARVMVNRIWQHLFGRGIVATSDNFGVLGQRPTHPALLDYLATRFRSDGWSIKRLIREMMLTQAYQMASFGTKIAEQRDPSNLLLHRANVRRLEGEAIRDALLSVSGRLDPTQFGPPVRIHLSPFMEGRGRPEQSGPLDGNGRRSIYLEVRRNFLSPFMLAFDTPLPASTVGRRNTSNVPAQALSMMNDPFIIEQCRAWAARALAEADHSPEHRVTGLYLAAFSRPPSEAELTDSTDFLADQAKLYAVGIDDIRPWADLCHVLVNVKEFIFIK
jgi:cytochrome c553